VTICDCLVLVALAAPKAARPYDGTQLTYQVRAIQLPWWAMDDREVVAAICACWSAPPWPS
jgi:hypothetical protein